MKVVDVLKATWILLRAGWRLIKLLVGFLFHPRARLVRLKSVYDLAVLETSQVLGKPPPPGVTLSDKMADLLKHLPGATAILETPSDSAFALENPIQGMIYFTESLEKGIKLKEPIPARVLRSVNEYLMDDTISDAQKEKIFRFAVESYLVGHLAPVTVLENFSNKLDELLLKTKYRTREEMLQELKKAQAQNASYAQMIHHFESGNKQMAEKLKYMSQKVETTGEDVAQIKEQTAGIPYFVDQDTEEARTDFRRINALKVSLGLNEIEQNILRFHDQKYTQQQIADKLKVNIRTVQRNVTVIEKKFSDRGLPSPFVWNNRKKNSEE